MLHSYLLIPTWYSMHISMSFQPFSMILYILYQLICLLCQITMFFSQYWSEKWWFYCLKPQQEIFMVWLCCLDVVQLDLLLNLHHLCLNTQYTCKPDVEFLFYLLVCLYKCRLWVIWLNMLFSNFLPDFQEVIFMHMIICIAVHNSIFLIIYTYHLHEKVYLMVSHIDFVIWYINSWRSSIIILFRHRNFCILIYIVIFITNDFWCHGCLQWVKLKENLQHFLVFYLIHHSSPPMVNMTPLSKMMFSTNYFCQFIVDYI